MQTSGDSDFGNLPSIESNLDDENVDAQTIDNPSGSVNSSPEARLVQESRVHTDALDDLSDSVDSSQEVRPVQESHITNQQQQDLEETAHDTSEETQDDPSIEVESNNTLDEGQAELFCPLHLVRFWDKPHQLMHTNHMEPYEGEPSYDSLPRIDPIDVLDSIHQEEFNLDGYDFLSYQKLIDCVKNGLHRLMLDALRGHKACKASIRTYIKFERIVPSDTLENTVYAWFNNLDGANCSYGVMKALVHPSEIFHFINDTVASVEERISQFVKTASGLRVERIMRLQLVLVDYEPLGGGTYMPLPKLIEKFKGRHVINVNNSEELAEWGPMYDIEVNGCFFWSVLAAERLYKRLKRGGDYKNTSRRAKNQITMRSYRASFGRLKGLKEFQLPMTVDQVDKFERLNPQYRITIIGYQFSEVEIMRPDAWEEILGKLSENNETDRKTAQAHIKNRLFPMYTSKNRNPDAIDISLLMLKEDEDDEYERSRAHFVAVKDLAKFMSVSGKSASHFCHNCLQTFYSVENKDMHMKYCAKFGMQMTCFPENKALTFKDYKYTVRTPYRIMADFEAVLIDSEFPHKASKLSKVADHQKYIFHRSQTGGNTKFLQEHKIIGYAWVCINWNDEIESHNVYLAKDDEEDVATTFLNEMIDLGMRLKSELDDMQELAKHTMVGGPQNCSDAEVYKYKNCCFCKKRLYCGHELVQPDKDDPDHDEKEEIWLRKKTVRHHSHYPPFKFVGLAHDDCNLSARFNYNTCIFLHNFSAYDCHPIIRALANVNVPRISIIPCTSERYMALTLRDSSYKDHESTFNLTFLDSLKFLNSSLDTQAKLLSKSGPDAFAITRGLFEKLYPQKKEHIPKLYAKQVYPYNFLKCVKDLEYDRVPPKEAFYNNLRDEPLSDEDYAFACDVWESFGIKSMGEWTKVYNLVDVTILADAWIKFSSLFIREFDLDPANFLSLPMLAWYSALKHSEVELELIDDSETYMFIESAVRGGLSCGGDIRYAESNNKYCEGYDAAKDTSFIVNLDANSLYPFGCSTYLPVSSFEFLPPEEVSKFTVDHILSLGDEDEYGFMMEVDLEFDPKDHDRFSAFPPVPYKRVVDQKEISPYQQDIFKKLNLTEACMKTEKLMADLYDRKEYVLHYVELKSYISMGVKLTNVRRVLKFKQKPWLRGYMDFCTQRRAATNDSYESNQFKMAMNAVYGRSIVNKRGRKRANFVRSRAEVLKLSKKATICDVLPISEHMALVFMKQQRVRLDAPIYTGVVTLSRAKQTMYDFYYKFLQPMYGVENVKMLGTDTDSFFLHLKCEDFYADMKNPEISDIWYDRSDYLEDDPILGAGMYDPKNKKVRGMFKDVTAQEGPITKFIYLKSKMYSYVTKKHKLEMKGKGIPNYILKRDHALNDYARVLFDDAVTSIKAKRFQSVQHKIHTVEIKKIAMTNFDTKRYYVDTVNSVAFGHHKIPK